jgi:hypothetical protein
MRSEKELWELVLSRQDLFKTGLCFWISTLRFEDLISPDEQDLLIFKLEESNPILQVDDVYLWKKWQIQPRIDWINERIKQIDDEQKQQIPE